MSYELSFLHSLIVTLIIEVPIVFLLSKYIYKNTDKFKIIFAGAISSLLTLPYFWFILPFYITNRFNYILIGESAIFLIEAIIYFGLLKVKFKQALLISFISNLSSFLIGLLVM